MVTPVPAARWVLHKYLLSEWPNERWVTAAGHYLAVLRHIARGEHPSEGNRTTRELPPKQGFCLVSPALKDSDFQTLSITEGRTVTPAHFCKGFCTSVIPGAEETRQVVS